MCTAANMKDKRQKSKEEEIDLELSGDGKSY